ncbi:hypothetical protein J437_LFUL011497 [Ladona fulva]|uniref:Down syndrome cell adhesion molecule-like protein Dscam2 n=1 Tax=Ladona fulva TaxID=123851 RepID=A0A8K0K8J1_LADFU|nr:hypothetical protein J437_LFUL011497 [Ladona fulva]
MTTIHGLQKYTNYSIRVAAFTSSGIGVYSEPIHCLTAEDVPPPAPKLEVFSVGSNNVTMQWGWGPGIGAADAAIDAGGPILGFVLSHKREHGDWKEERLGRRETRHTLTDLPCGTLHFLHISAFNRVGMGDASSVAAVHTRGEPPTAPPVTEALDANSHSITVHLEKWNDGDCPMKPFHVEKQAEGDPWGTVPGPPSGIRVALSAPYSAIVSWSPPVEANGLLLRYHLYEREVVRRGGGDPIRRNFLASQTQTTVAPLREHSSYEFWVTAATRIGEGPSTKVVSISANSRGRLRTRICSISVPAAILSFGRVHALPWRTNALLPCQYVGNPRPELHWTHDLNPISFSQRTRLYDNGTLAIHEVQKQDYGNYTCHVKNVHNMEKVVHVLKVLESTAPATSVEEPPPNPNTDVKVQYYSALARDQMGVDTPRPPGSPPQAQVSCAQGHIPVTTNYGKKNILRFKDI